MKLPKQPTQIEKDRQALAPYNFVELPEQIAKLVDAESPDRQKQAGERLPDQNKFHADRHSGWIACRLITESPLYVRAARTLEQVRKRVDSKDVPEFFYVNDKNQPVIPGSSLRGMLRAIIEIVSFSKVSEVSDSRLVYRAVGDTTSHGTRYRERLMRDDGNHHYTPKMLGGYMRLDKEKSQWFIQPAQEIDGTTFARIRIDEDLFDRLQRIKDSRNAYEIYVKPDPYKLLPVRGGFLHVRAARVAEASAHPEPGFIEGTLARSGRMFSKRTEAVVYPPDKAAPRLWLSDEQIDDYCAQISQEQEGLLGKDGVLVDVKPDRATDKEPKGQPVFYTLTERGEVEFFGHCRMLRLPYKATPRDHVPESLRRKDDIDLAEAIFGFTKDLKKADGYAAKERRYAGRVTVGDARMLPDQDDPWLSPTRTITPRVLASPKPTTFQHYLVQIEPNNIRIGETRDGRPKYEVRLRDYAANKTETAIRGHKLYWQKGASGLPEIELKTQVKGTQLTKIQPLRAGVKFEFRIRFDNLSDEELGAILWVLQKAADERYRLKIGMGKPLGMGAIKIASSLSLIDRTERYRRLFDDDDWAAGQKDESVTGQTLQKALTAFEQFVLKRIEPKGLQRLEESERIRQLLAMLSWPGPAPSLTRYLEIERPDPTAKRGKRNEYDSRPVLPLPPYVGRPVLPPPSVVATPKSEPTPPGFKRGKIKSFGLGPKASYGFIQPDGGGQDVFLHINALQGSHANLKPGVPVIYRERRGQRGMEAAEARVVE